MAIYLVSMPAKLEYVGTAAVFFMCLNLQGSIHGELG